ncbi:hypothetical protein OS493_036665 [Desmophyllum pertusum]|uniref:Uncharacterized protein n=1 Tax=Desmophyllum pertusum TaxID=174260 RepID=A0A9W9Y7A7_9CNID|nr:hypothetical protein OS493_036665 [Desmophyllum pertusum]
MLAKLSHSPMHSASDFIERSMIRSKELPWLTRVKCKCGFEEKMKHMKVVQKKTAKRTQHPTSFPGSLFFPPSARLAGRRETLGTRLHELHNIDSFTEAQAPHAQIVSASAVL